MFDGFFRPEIMGNHRFSIDGIFHEINQPYQPAIGKPCHFLAKLFSDGRVHVYPAGQGSPEGEDEGPNYSGS